MHRSCPMPSSLSKFARGVPSPPLTFFLIGMMQFPVFFVDFIFAPSPRWPLSVSLLSHSPVSQPFLTAFSQKKKGRAGTHGPPPEMQLSLASLLAPKLGCAPGIADEQFAWDSREFLRKKCIGKQVGPVCCLFIRGVSEGRTLLSGVTALPEGHILCTYNTPETSYSRSH